MLLLRGAHAMTFGFMAAVGRLKFGERITPAKHKWLLTALAAFFLLGYPWLFTVWLVILVGKSLRGRVAVGDGFLVTLPTRTNNPKPTVCQIGVSGVIGAAFVAVLFGVTIANIYAHPVLVWIGLSLTLGSAVGSALIRRRNDDLSSLQGTLLVEGLVPTSSRFRHTARTVAPVWLQRQNGPVGWVADEGLKSFYEDILTCWGVKGVPVNPGRTGFWGLLWPARYSFVKP